MHYVIRVALLLMTTQLALAQAVEKEQAAKQEGCVPAELSLLQVVNDVEGRLKKRFAIDPRLSPCVKLATPVDARRLSYAEFQALLAVHGYVDTMEVNGVTAIVPDASLRLSPIRLIDDGERNVGEHEAVIKLLDPGPLSSAQLVPMLRPMLPQYAHLVADAQTNTLIVVGRYGNVRTIENLLRSLRKREVVAKYDSDGTRSGMARVPAKQD